MAASARLPQTGDVFAGKYLVESVLGEGGFGIVLRARAADSNRLVALKILKPGESGYDLNQATRFLREMRTIAQLQCPFTLTLYDYGKTDGLLYMVTEFVDGEDLDKLLDRRRTLEEREVVHIVYQVLQSLGEAHQLGVLHRDIKPKNIRIFAYEQNPLMVKVLDFGLAQTLDGSQTKLTATGRVIGTPRYMAPERIDEAPLTPASDIYSLGIVAMELLLGAPAIVRRFGELVTIPDDAPVSARVRAIVNRMVAIAPSERYQSTAEILRELRDVRPSAALQHISAPAPVPVAPIAPVAAQLQPHPPLPMSPSAPTAEEAPPEDPETKRTYGLAIAGTLGLLVFAVAVFAMLNRSPPDPEPRRVVLPPTEARTAPSIVAERQPVVESLAPDLGTAPGGCGRENVRTALQTETLYDGVTPRGWAHYAPDDYDSAREYPVLLLVTDTKAKPDELIDHLDLRKGAREVDAVVVAVGTPASGAVRIVEKVLDEAAELYCIDRQRIVVIAQSDMDGVVRDLTCEGVASARMYRPKRDYSRDEVCWNDRVVPTVALAGFQMTPKKPPVDQHALSAHACKADLQVSDEEKRLRCHSGPCDPLLVVCRQDGHVHFEVALLAKYREALFAPAEAAP